MAGVQLVDLTKKFGSVLAVNHLSLEVRDCEFMTFLGPSGCGKTTTLNMISGLETPSSGSILIDGERVNQVSAAERNIAMVFQNYALYPHMTVRQNMSFALAIRKTPRETINKKVEDAAALLGLDGLLDRYPRELSGGQRQRVALGRAIIRNPKVFLLDEPLSNLDAALRLQMRAELKLLFTRLKATVVYVTHDQAEAMTLSDRIAVFREGVVQQVGTPLEIYYRPANQFVARFVGSPPMNLFDGHVVDEHGAIQVEASDFAVSLPKEAEAAARQYCGRPVVLGLRPEDLDFATDGPATIDAQVRVVEHLGAETLIHVSTGSQTLTMKASGTMGTRVNEPVKIAVKANRVYLFDKETGASCLTALPEAG